MHKRKILIADDDPAILEALTMMLEDAGYETETTMDGKTVQEVKERPDLILLDIWMSGMDGRDICKHVKSKNTTKQIPIIMVSANRDAERIAKEAGADGFIAKPFDMSELLAKVSTYISP